MDFMGRPDVPLTIWGMLQELPYFISVPFDRFDRSMRFDYEKSEWTFFCKFKSIDGGSGNDYIVSFFHLQFSKLGVKHPFSIMDVNHFIPVCVFEVIIHDDASTDETQEIIKKYQKEYPGLIVPIIQEENQYSQKRSIFNPALKAARGRYIAVCEGDDYWTDPDKLQKQYDFMEKNPEYSVCYHDAFIFKEESLVSPSKLPRNMRRDFSANELILNNCFILTLSMFFRKCFSELPKESSGVVNGDNFIISMLGLHGRGKYIESISPAAYRLHEESIWSSISSEKKSEALVHTFSKLAEHHKREKRMKEFRYYREKSDRLLQQKTGR